MSPLKSINLVKEILVNDVAEENFITVRASEFKAEDKTYFLTVRGRTEVEKKVMLKPKTSSTILKKLDKGSFVKKGQTICTLDPENSSAALNEAIANKCPYILFTCSGGARMQEGIVSLMQMPRTVAAVELLNKNNIPYIVVLTDPTTGGVTASFAMLGDITIAEKGSTIGFAGKRVIQDTIREELPIDFQKAEYLLEHGMVDIVVHRKDLKNTLSDILEHICK